MTLYELIHQLQEINYKVTSADFETNVLSVNANLEGNWKNWSVKIHTADEERLAEEGEELAYNCEKKGRQEMLDKACKWLKDNLYHDEMVETETEILEKADFIQLFKRAMEK